MSERWLVIGAFAATYIIWGSTYMFNYWAIDTIPPFFMSGMRFFVAGLLLYAWGIYKKEPIPTTKEWGNTALIGNLFLSIGTGLAVWALQWLDTGVTSLLVAFDPLLIMLLLWLLVGQKPRGMAIIGAFVAIAGMSLLIDQPQFTDSEGAKWGLMAMAVALFSWAIASIYVSRIKLPESRLRSSAMQMITGGGALLLYSIFSGEAFTFSWSKLSLSSTLSWVYLVFLGSIIAFSSFNYLLAKVSPEKVATNTYVNPVVALFLGWTFNNEIITSQSILASAVLITGVFFINSNMKK